MVNNLLLCAAMTLCLVALPGFLIMLSVSGIVNVMCLVVPAPSFHSFFSMEDIVITQGAQ